MNTVQEIREEQCDARLCLKTQDQTLMRQAISGAGLTPWEALPITRRKGLDKGMSVGMVRACTPEARSNAAYQSHQVLRGSDTLSPNIIAKREVN